MPCRCLLSLAETGVKKVDYTPNFPGPKTHFSDSAASAVRLRRSSESPESLGRLGSRSTFAAAGGRAPAWPSRRGLTFLSPSELSTLMLGGVEGAAAACGLVDGAAWECSVCLHGQRQLAFDLLLSGKVEEMILGNHVQTALAPHHLPFRCLNHQKSIR